MDVGIRELKARLSKYVERADRGETIRVTSRGRLRALLVAPGPDDPLEDPIGRGMREGWITPARRRVGWARGWSGCRAPAAAKSSSARIVASEPVRRLQRPASSATSMSRTARRSPPSSPGDRGVVTVRLTLVEARRALARVLSGSDLERVQARFARD